MKYPSLFLLGLLFIFSCSPSKEQEKNLQSETEQTVDIVNKEKDIPLKKFNIEEIPYSNANLESFPYFSLPKGLKSQNKPFQKDFDVCFFPIAGTMTPFEGKLYKIFVVGDGKEPFSKRYFEKSLDNFLSSIDAIKIFDGEITKEEYDRYQKQDPNKGADGDIGYTDEMIKFYVIRTKDKGNIYVQFSSNNISGKLNILQEEPFNQTIEKITADDILKELSEHRKSILYLNFETDKHQISEEGKNVVDEITNALKKDISLKISIDGYTDNIGDAAHNTKLSNDRANAVMNALIANGIAKERLTAKGFGAAQPLVENNTDAQRAKNRRVELVKKN